VEAKKGTQLESTYVKGVFWRSPGGRRSAEKSINQRGAWGLEDHKIEVLQGEYGR